MLANTYRHSGNMSVAAPFVLIGCGLLSSSALGIAYVFVVNWIPLIYAALAAPLAFGAALGAIFSQCASAYRIRNNPLVVFITLLCSLWGLYLAWIFDGMARFGVGNVPVLWNPLHLANYITTFYSEGFGRERPSYSWTSVGGSLGFGSSDNHRAATNDVPFFNRQTSVL
jgi:hypothetical protein